MTQKTVYNQNWKAYDQAQTHEQTLFMELLGELCRGIEQPYYQFGRPKKPLSDMVFASALKVYSTFSLRRFVSLMQYAIEKRCIDRTCSYSTISNYMRSPEITPILHDLIEKSSLPLASVEKHFAVDSSGFSTSRFERWYKHKYGRERSRRVWVKAHVSCGVKTNIITAVKLTDGWSSDCRQFPELVERTAENFQVDYVSADKAYLSVRNLKLVDDMGGEAYIPFKKNTAINANKKRIWKKMYHMFQLQQDYFMERYHKRSNVETCFHMIKSKFGDSVRSKSEIGQYNEILLKILCHNICVVIQEMMELGLEAKFN